MLRSNSIFAVLLCLMILQLGCNPESAYRAPPTPKVSVAQPVVKTIPIYLEENGQTEAVEQAIVQSRVKGIVEKIEFEPFQRVEQGTLLFQIEEEEFLIAVQSAQATVAAAEAAKDSAEVAIGVAESEVSIKNAAIAMANARINVTKAERERIENLRGAVSQSEIDTAVAANEEAKAALNGAEADKTRAEKAVDVNKAKLTSAAADLQKAEADLATKKLDLERTKVLAPISGRINKPMVKRGNLMEKGTPLVEIIKNDPIWANFSVSSRFVLEIEKSSKRQPGEELDLSSIKVMLQRDGDVGYPFTGRLDYLEPKMDAATGTMKMRAVFDNQVDNGPLLYAGLFVRVRVEIGEDVNAIMIPERAVSRDQIGSFIFVVGDEGKAVRKNVKLGTKRDSMVVIESGLDANDSVIVDGIQRVRAGAKVDPS